jgi:hypothetical protein
VAIKDRAAILPGGFLANASYWYDKFSGTFVSSTYYMDELPEWIKIFNNQRLPEKLMASVWTLSLPESEYETALPDTGHGEDDEFDEGKTVFPHTFDHLSLKQKWDKIRSTPFGNSLTTDFILELIKNEKPGEGKYTDFLAISYSSPDYIGHSWGPNSMEVMDSYIKLDLEISRILNTLDRQIGKGNYLLFLTSDHGVRPNALLLNAHQIPGGGSFNRSMKKNLRMYCEKQFGDSLIICSVNDNQIYLNHAILEKNTKVKLTEVYSGLVNYLRNNYPHMGAICTRPEMNPLSPTRSLKTFLLNGFHPHRSGDILFEMGLNYTNDSHKTGTTHGSPYDYDTHVPLIFYGWHVTPGKSNQEVYIIDIAPTIADLVHIQEPNGTTGKPLIDFNNE